MCRHYTGALPVQHRYYTGTMSTAFEKFTLQKSL